MKQRLFSLITLLAFLLGLVAYDVIPCGAPNGECEVYCGYNCDWYTSNYNYNYCCQLESIDYSNVTDDDASILDLSGMQLFLDRLLWVDLKHDFPKEKVQTLVLSNNSFYFRNLNSLSQFVSLFPNLTSLDLSNSVIPPRYADYYSKSTSNIEQIMGNVTGLFMVDISNNYDAWSISSETFNAMTNLEELHMKDCCSNINEEITPELFRDLVNLEFLDISSTEWDGFSGPSLLYASQKLTHLNMTGLNHLPDMTRALQKQKNLQSLDLSGSAVEETIEVVSENITEIHLRRCKFDNDLPLQLSKPWSLRKLDLTGSSLDVDLSVFPENLFGLEWLSLKNTKNFVNSYSEYYFANNTNIEFLDLSGVHLYLLSATLFNSLPNLNTLIIQNAYISYSPNDWGWCPFKTLELLNLAGSECSSGCGFWKLLGQYCNIITLDMRQTKGFSLDFNSVFPNVTEIDLTEATAQKVYMENLPELTSLLLTRARIETKLTLHNLPSLSQVDFTNLASTSKYSPIELIEVSDLPELTTLDFSQLSFENLEVSSLTALSSISFDMSEINAIALSDLPEIVSLNFKGSKIGQLAMSNLPNLRGLDLSGLDINNINITGFESLITDLGLEYEQFLDATTPGAFLSNFKNLQSLSLAHNFIDELPADFFTSNPYLKKIDLSYNYLNYLTWETVEQVVTLQRHWLINLEGNLLDCGDCRNKWMSNKEYKYNLKGALCETPYEEYHMHVTDVEICA